MTRYLRMWPTKPAWYAIWQKRRYRQKRFFFRLTLIIILVLGLTAALILIRSSVELRRQAALSQPVTVVVEFTYDQNENHIAVNRANAVNRPIKASNKKPSKNEAVSVVGQDNSIISYPITWITEIHADDFNQLLGMDEVQPVETAYKLPKPVAIGTIQYIIGDKIKLASPHGQVEQDIDTHIIDQTVRDSNSDIQIQDQPAIRSNDVLDIAYIPNHYLDMNQFRKDARNMHNFLLTLHPFKISTHNIKAHYVKNQTDLGCFRPASIPRLIVCDYYLVTLAVGAIPADQIIVIENSNEYGGSGSPGLAVTYSDLSAYAKEVMVHEFGHSFGRLNDEYYLGPYFTGLPRWANCSHESICTKWQGIPGAGCIPGCGYSNLYRPTYNDSLMRTLFPDNGFKFGPVSEEHLLSLLASYTGITNSDIDMDDDTDFMDLHLLLQRSTPDNHHLIHHASFIQSEITTGLPPTPVSD
jgi:hypothetical protein